MAKYMMIVEAIQWFKNGDHPEDGNERFAPKSVQGKRYEGRVVRFFRRPDVDGDTKCDECGYHMHMHGWIEDGGKGYNVCPGDFIVTGFDGQHYPVHPDEFKKKYRLVEE